MLDNIQRTTAHSGRETMTITTIFDTCHPRSDVLHGGISDTDFAADLASVVSGSKATEYRDPVRFFADTYVTPLPL